MKVDNSMHKKEVFFVLRKRRYLSLLSSLIINDERLKISFLFNLTYGFPLYVKE